MDTYRNNPIKLLLKAIPFYRFFRKAEKWSRDELEAYQLRKLQEITEYAYNHVPYYKDKYKEIGFHPGDIKSFEDFAKLPCLTKEILRENPPNYFLSNEFKNTEISYIRTSGSTGIPLSFACDLFSRAANYAVTYRAFHAAGYNIGNVQFILKNLPNLESACSYEKLSRQLNMHVYRLNKEGVNELIPLLKQHQPKHILAHPTELLELGKYLKNPCEYFRNLKSITSFSEVLHPILRKSLQNLFNCPVFDYYSNKESSLVAYEIENHEYIFGEHFCFPEIRPISNDNCKTINELSGELISTAFYSYAMPLIRYCNADIVSLRKPTKDNIVKYYHVNEVQGRVAEKIKLPSGFSVGINNLMKADLENVNMYQFVQTGKDILEIHYIPSYPGAPIHEKEILDEIRSYIGSEMNIYIKEVKELNKNRGGKTPRVICLYDEKQD